MKRIPLFLAVITLTATAASAQTPENCPSIDLIAGDQPGAGIKAWNQSDSTSCYSFAASFLANVWIRDQWAQADSSLQYYFTNPYQNYDSITESGEYNEILDAEKGRTCQAFTFTLNQERIQLSNPVNLLFSTPKCEMWGIDLDPSGTRKVLKSPSEIESEMHRLLVTTERPLPYAVEYCSAVFDYPGYDFITNREFRPTLTYLNDPQESKENFSPNCGFHSAVVVGQAMRNGACYFKVRNSTGTFHPFARNIERGNYWIRADSLARNTLRLVKIAP